MDANAQRDVAIIGGGIGGLTAALAFARRGAQVTVYERAAALTEVGAGIQITPNGARVLEHLGLSQALTDVGKQAVAVQPTDALTGQAITRFDVSQTQPPYRFFHRAGLIDLLADACRDAGVRLVLNAHITDLRPDGSFDGPHGAVTPTLTIGADGLHSVVRPLMNAAADPFFTRQVAWRAVVQAPDAEPVARIWMAPGRHIVTYPLPGGLLNIVAVQERDTWAAEGWNHADDPDNLRAAFGDVCPEMKSILSQITYVNLWGLFRHPVAANWFAGSVAILGDAAHPTLPFLAQGANLAIEDAYVLARMCDEHAVLDVALRAYQDGRKPRVARAIEAANANAMNYHLSGVKRQMAHAALRIIGKTAPQMFLKRLNWLYDHDVTA